MPAIQPERLTKDVAEIQDLFQDPPKLRQRLVEMLEFFSDRTRRSGATLHTKDTEKKYGVPIPVMKTLERGLKQSLSENSEFGPAVFKELWQVECRETRLLAIALLENYTFNEILLGIESWSHDTDDYELLAKLSQSMVIHWGREQYSDFTQILTNWLKSGRFQNKLLSLMSMQFAIHDPNFEDIPTIFNLIQVHEISSDHQLRRAFFELLRSLLKRCTPETARYLLDILEKDKQQGRRLVKELLQDFPPDQQIQLRHALSAK